jgi:parallel beta-helix repeat protein
MAGDFGAGVYCGYNTATAITNCIFAGNQNAAIGKPYSSGVEISAKYCLFNGNTGGDYYDESTDTTYIGAGQLNGISDAFERNVDGDPNFAFADDPHLMSGSACIDRGTNDPAGGLPDTDMDGNPRILDGDGDTVAVVDIGALEYNSELPSIAVSPPALEFVRERGGPNPDSRYLQIRNCGGGVLNWHIDCNCPWLEVSPTDGSSSGQIDEMLVAVDTNDLPQGIHRTLLSVTDPNAVNTPWHISVTLRIKGTLYVPEQYATIQDAIDAAMEDELIEVAEGTYNEAVRLDKRLDLIGIDRPVIDANETHQRAVTISADGCTIDGFTITRGTVGIDVESSDNIISNSAIKENTRGIELSSGSANNTLTSNEISNNTYIGLLIVSSPQNTLRDNEIAGSEVNFEINGGPPEHFTQDIDTSNTVDGKPIYYLVGAHNTFIDAASNAGCVVAVNCSSIIVKDLTLTNNAKGVLFIRTSFSRIENVAATDNANAGIWLDESSNNTLIGNTVSGCYHGIVLYRSASNTLRDNIMLNNLYNFACEASSATDYEQNIATSNTVDGRPIYYLVGETGTTVDRSSLAGCVFAVGCANITVRDLSMENNGTAVALIGTTNATIERVTVRNNQRAGVLLRESRNTVIKQSRMLGNYDGIYVEDSQDILLDRSVISQNAQGVNSRFADIEITNCFISGNNDGGGVYASYGSEATITNCTIYGNSAPQWYSYRAGGIHCEYDATTDVSNCIVWANWPYQIEFPSDESTVTYSDVQGGFQGQGNINTPPLLTPDGHLQANSPCIDKGRYRPPYPPQDFDGEIRGAGRGTDMGCDQFIDADSDGLPDWWEAEYFGVGDTAMPDNDWDGDTHTNLREYELFSSNPIVACNVYYVDANQPDNTGDGLSWETALQSVQSAVDAAENSDKIYLARGSYQENVMTLGRHVVIQSVDTLDPDVVASTRLNGSLIINSGEMTGCTIAGLTISNPSGFGVLCKGTSPTIRRCVISDNRSHDWEQGGGISCFSAGPTIAHCVISGNRASGTGHGIYCDRAVVTISNSVVSGNEERDAIYLTNSNLTMKSCTITGQSTYHSHGPIVDCRESDLQITNSILSGDADRQIEGRDSWVTITYSNIRGGVEAIDGDWWGHGNINVDPCFVDPGHWAEDGYYGSWVDGDYHLKSQGWRWTRYKTHGANWVWDERTSLCIDAGSPASPLADELLAVPVDPDSEWGENLRINMGVYGGTSQASMAPHQWAVCADLTNDGTVDLHDFVQWAQDLQAGRDAPGADLDRNGIVTLADFALLAADWLAQTSWCGTVTPLPPLPAP